MQIFCINYCISKILLTVFLFNVDKKKNWIAHLNDSKGLNGNIRPFFGCTTRMIEEKHGDPTVNAKKYNFLCEFIMKKFYIIKVKTAFLIREENA